MKILEIIENISKKYFAMIISEQKFKAFKLHNLNFRSTCCTGSQETSMKNNCVNIPYSVYVYATTHLTILHLPFKCTYVPLRWSLMSHSTPIEILTTNLFMEFLNFDQIFVKSLFRLRSADWLPKMAQLLLVNPRFRISPIFVQKSYFYFLQPLTV